MSRAVGLTHLPSRVDPLPSESYTNYVRGLRAPQLLCHHSAPFKSAQSLGSLHIDHTYMVQRGTPSFCMASAQVLWDPISLLWHFQVEQASPRCRALEYRLNNSGQS